MNLWDLPRHNIKSILKLPFDAVKAPKRFWDGTMEMLKDIPTNLRNLIGNTRQNIESVLGNIMSLSPRQTVDSIIKTGRDGINDLFLNPLKSHAKPFSRPVLPLAELPVGATKILAKSKIQYATAFRKGFSQLLDAGKRIWNSPGHELNMKALQDLRGIAMPPARPATTAPAASASRPTAAATAPAAA